MTNILLRIEILLLLIFSLLVVKTKKVDPKAIQPAVSSTWIGLGLGEKIGAIESHAREIKDNYKSFEQMLRVPTERGSFGELSLETIISDQLPPNLYGVREKILDTKYPDAYIRSTAGIICIDSKFPLDNYVKMLNEPEVKRKEIYRNHFFKNVAGHLTKITEDYVCPDKGSAEFAFAYIPSEGVYYFLITEAYEMLRAYTKRGVQVVSPLTLSHKIELIKAGVHAKRLSESAEKVKNSLLKLSQRFSQMDERWQLIYRTHFKTLQLRLEELDEIYRKISEEFNKIYKFTEE